ncbi:carbon-nitrogen family hydrolase [Kineosporia babensis]|uniref:Carbon-nitrogen family hydrolase n=1 Tax=Kineosporia babensis TaxID=499548 RepID=A0A9X1N9V8_9ACTN|nr:carbon-nitrogen family hydrolase [Kineosporia babensis]MCD5309886.1 carbon-nitrogen family hydrolase [Kineosporia babensis]
MRVHVLQLAYPDDEPVAERVARAAALVAAQSGADLVVLPELWAPTGFGYQGWSEAAEPVEGPTVTAICRAAQEIGAYVHAGSIIERAAEGADRGPQGRGLWNTSVLIDRDGLPMVSYRKVHRFGFSAGEPDLIEAGTELVTAGLQTGSGHVTAGLATCYDLRFPELFRNLSAAGAELFVVPAAWPAARVEHWRVLGRARAIENQAIVIQCNTAGTHAGVRMGGHSQVVSATGEVLAEAGPDDETVLVADVDLEAAAQYRQKFPVLADRRL